MNFLKTALLSLVLCSLVSCIKPPLDEDEVAASADEVQGALAEAWGMADPLTMTVGDYIFQETEQKIDSHPEPIFVLQEGLTISKKEDLPKEYKYTYLYQHRTFTNGKEGPVSTREDTRSVGKPEGSLLALKNIQARTLSSFADDYQMTLGFEKLYGLAYACYKSPSLDQYCKEELGVDSCDIKCSNLSVHEELRPVPDLIKAQPNCGNFDDCKIRTKKVDFDWTLTLFKGANQESQKVNYSITLSQDLPFFARVTDYCFRRLYPVKDQMILVSSCTKLKNYKPATP